LQAGINVVVDALDVCALELLRELELDELLLELLFRVEVVVVDVVVLTVVVVEEPDWQAAPRWQPPERPTLTHLHCKYPVELGW
jgi:hypothetical protein